jgi:predicted Zn-dependent protease
MRFILSTMALSLALACGLPGAVIAAGTEPELTPTPAPAAVECTEADKTKCPQPAAVECTEADKSKCPQPAAVECAEADKSKCPQPAAVECTEADKTKCPPATEQKKEGFLRDYRAAVAMIEAGDYDDALVAMRALDDGTSADVVNYIGFIHRKLGKMAEAQMYYEAALHMQPDHRGALEYYGEWFVMMGRMEKAQEHLSRIASLYGSDTKEYEALAKMIQDAEKS